MNVTQTVLTAAVREGTTDERRPSIALVRGARAGGSSFSAVIERLQPDGYHVTAPQFPESSLAAETLLASFPDLHSDLVSVAPPRHRGCC
jgi:hypothetical protein